MVGKSHIECKYLPHANAFGNNHTIKASIILLYTEA